MKHRLQADQEAYALVTEKSLDPRWSAVDYTIEVDSRSRFYDPYDPDFPPMPPDDPAAHAFMRCVDNKKGFPQWDKNGHVQDLENPGWREMLASYTEQTADGKIRLTLDNAVMLALVHSPEWQEQLETVYLSALDVSTERFRFDVRFFGGNVTAYDHLGSERNGGSDSNVLSLNNSATANRRLATAGEVVVGFANSFVWQFTGQDQGFATSIFNFNIIQPLLRGGGQVVALERLTRAERGLLANVRALYQARQGLYTDVAIGQSGVGQPSRQGGFFGGTGLTGFTGQGGSGFGGIGDVTGFGFAGGTGVGGGAAGSSGLVGGGEGTIGGFLGMLQQLQEIRNTQASLADQRREQSRLEEYVRGERLKPAEVNQFGQNINSEEANLLQAEDRLQVSLDEFKRGTLGLPPDLEIELDDSILEQFRFVTDETERLQTEVTDFVARFGTLPLVPGVAELQAALDQLDTLSERAAERLANAPDIITRLDDDLRERRSMQPGKLAAKRQKFSGELAALIQQLDGVAADIDSLQANLQPANVEATANQAMKPIGELVDILGELASIESQANLEQIHIRPIELTGADALEIARANRLDWMNRRARLVDTWRLIEFNANALKSDLTVNFSGDIQTLGGTAGNNAAKFRDQSGSLRASLQIDPPFTRLEERNNFRQQLIEYQRDRRSMIQFEDRIFVSLRSTLRNLRRFQKNLEIQRDGVDIAIGRVEEARASLSRPAPARMPGEAPQTLGPTDARNLLDALKDLRATKNVLLSVWINYQATRMQLYRDLGIMRIDDRGIWIDEPLEAAIRASSIDCGIPPEVPEDWLEWVPTMPLESAETSQSAISDRKLAISGQRSAISDQEPAIRNQEPTSRSQEPGSNNRETENQPVPPTAKSDVELTTWIDTD